MSADEFARARQASRSVRQSSGAEDAHCISLAPGRRVWAKRDSLGREKKIWPQVGEPNSFRAGPQARPARRSIRLALRVRPCRGWPTDWRAHLSWELSAGAPLKPPAGPLKAPISVRPIDLGAWRVHSLDRPPARPLTWRAHFPGRLLSPMRAARARRPLCLSDPFHFVSLRPGERME